MIVHKDIYWFPGGFFFISGNGESSIRQLWAFSQNTNSHAIQV